jgi:hypothetical protein
MKPMLKQFGRKEWDELRGAWNFENAMTMLIAEKLIKPKQKEYKMDNVTFFDKNGVELNVGDMVISDSGLKGSIDFFRFGQDTFACAHLFGRTGFFALEKLTKHTPKLVKVKRTFEEVCELRDSGALFKMADKSQINYKPTIATDDTGIYIDDFSSNCWLIKPKGSDVWEDAKYKEVEE